MFSSLEYLYLNSGLAHITMSQLVVFQNYLNNFNFYASRQGIILHSFTKMFGFIWC